jgi:hypothetical protein
MSVNMDAPMPEAVINPSRALSRPVLAVVVLCVALIGATLALWAHYGTAVFFEIIAAGIAACF